MRRIRRIETEFRGKSSDPLHSVDNGERIDRLARHHTRNERTFHRCLREFVTQQTNRGLRDREVDHAPLESAPPLASIEKLTKRSQSPDPRRKVQRVLDLLMAELGGETAQIVENFDAAGQGLQAAPQSAVPTA